MKELKLWNGRIYESGSLRSMHLAAYSMADARRLFVELGFNDPGVSEIKKYWSPCWGNAMIGITPERGIWITDHGKSKPRRLTKCSTKP